mmetsp:Transcript_103499/g.331842  ORF Transcript_103499/g.331842 Transcript_103499/m.331842 type:complete len:206 (+) Transcript_103499:1839-2456(+)
MQDPLGGGRWRFIIVGIAVVVVVTDFGDGIHDVLVPPRCPASQRIHVDHPVKPSAGTKGNAEACDIVVLVLDCDRQHAALPTAIVVGIEDDASLSALQDELELIAVLADTLWQQSDGHEGAVLTMAKVELAFSRDIVVARHSGAAVHAVLAKNRALEAASPKHGHHDLPSVETAQDLPSLRGERQHAGGVLDLHGTIVEGRAPLL